MALSDKQKQRVAGILQYLNDLLDKRFVQANRVSPRIATVEGDIRWHQIETMRQILESSKGFGPVKIVVGDILASADEEKKRDLFNPTNQVSIMNQVIPSDEEAHGAKKTAGQLEIRNVKTYYKALDPSLEKVLLLLQTWIWWDLRDASDLYRFEMQEQRLQNLKSHEFNAAMVEFYRKEMNIRPGVEVAKDDAIKFEMARTKEIVDLFEHRRAEEQGHEMILVREEREGSLESDATCVKLAKRLMAIEKARTLKDPVEESLKNFYAAQIGVPATQVTTQAILQSEEAQARRERQTLSEQLASGCKAGNTFNYKMLKLQDMKTRYENLCKLLGISPTAEAQPTAAPAAAATH
jgi:hypothetical protein